MAIERGKQMKRIMSLILVCSVLLCSCGVEEQGSPVPDSISENEVSSTVTGFEVSGSAIEEGADEPEPTTKKWFEEEKIELIVGPSSGFSETCVYIIELLDNGLITTYYGLNKEEEIGLSTEIYNIEIVEKKEAWLKENDLEKIQDMLVDIKNCEKGEEKAVFDSWEFRLCIGSDKYRRYYIDEEEEKVMELIQLLIELSPVYVDLHGFA